MLESATSDSMLASIAVVPKTSMGDLGSQKSSKHVDRFSSDGDF